MFSRDELAKNAIEQRMWKLEMETSCDPASSAEHTRKRAGRAHSDNGTGGSA